MCTWAASRTPPWASTPTTRRAAQAARPHRTAVALQAATTWPMPQPAERRHRRRRGPSLRIGSMNVCGICAPNRAQPAHTCLGVQAVPHHTAAGVQSRLVLCHHGCRAAAWLAPVLGAQPRAAAAAPRRSTAGPSPRCTLRGQRSSTACRPAAPLPHTPTAATTSGTALWPPPCGPPWLLSWAASSPPGSSSGSCATLLACTPEFGTLSAWHLWQPWMAAAASWLPACSRPGRPPTAPPAAATPHRPRLCLLSWCCRTAARRRPLLGPAAGPVHCRYGTSGMAAAAACCAPVHLLGCRGAPPAPALLPLICLRSAPFLAHLCSRAPCAVSPLPSRCIRDAPVALAHGSGWAGPAQSWGPPAAVLLSPLHVVWLALGKPVPCSSCDAPSLAF